MIVAVHLLSTAADCMTCPMADLVDWSILPWRPDLPLDSHGSHGSSRRIMRSSVQIGRLAACGVQKLSHGTVQFHGTGVCCSAPTNQQRQCANAMMRHAAKPCLSISAKPGNKVSKNRHKTIISKHQWLKRAGHRIGWWRIFETFWLFGMLGQESYELLCCWRFQSVQLVRFHEQWEERWSLFSRSDRDRPGH